MLAIYAIQPPRCLSRNVASLLTPPRKALWGTLFQTLSLVIMSYQMVATSKTCSTVFDSQTLIIHLATPSLGDGVGTWIFLLFSHIALCHLMLGKPTSKDNPLISFFLTTTIVTWVYLWQTLTGFALCPQLSWSRSIGERNLVTCCIKSDDIFGYWAPQRNQKRGVGRTNPRVGTREVVLTESWPKLAS